MTAPRLSALCSRARHWPLHVELWRIRRSAVRPAVTWERSWWTAGLHVWLGVWSYAPADPTGNGASVERR